MTIDLSGTAALVTGASRGIGAAIARQMAEAGAAVGVHFGKSRDAAEALAEEIGAGAQVFQADLARTGDCERLFDEAVAAFGEKLRVLVNNAGVALRMPLGASAADWQADWDRTMAVNLRAPEWLCRRFAAHVGETEGAGRVVNIASRAAFRGDAPEYMAYAGSKGGLVALTRSLARGFGESGLRAFVVAPGFTRTDMAQAFIDEFGEDYARSGIALERLTEPEDVAPLIVFLASGLADHATGASIDVNAGSYVH